MQPDIFLEYQKAYYAYSDFITIYGFPLVA